MFPHESSYWYSFSKYLKSLVQGKQTRWRLISWKLEIKSRGLEPAILYFPPQSLTPELLWYLITYPLPVALEIWRFVAYQIISTSYSVSQFWLPFFFLSFFKALIHGKPTRWRLWNITFKNQNFTSLVSNLWTFKLNSRVLPLSYHRLAYKMLNSSFTAFYLCFVGWNMSVFSLSDVWNCHLLLTTELLFCIAITLIYLELNNLAIHCKAVGLEFLTNAW